MWRIAISSFLVLAVGACGDGTATDAGQGGVDGFTATLSHTFPPVLIEPGREDLGKCQSWTLDNDVPLYVNKVRQTNEGAWHHSNWFFVPETAYPGADGTWDCSDRGFREVLAAALGGVFFAQSTQAPEETQVFPEGAVLEVPPRHKIVGDIHLVNVASTTLDTALTMEIETIPAEDVQIRLRPISFTNTSLAIDPQARSLYSMTCDLEPGFMGALGEVPNYNIYYVLAHYHEWGNFFNLSFVDEEGNERTVMEINTVAGEPLGLTMDPPVSSLGAAGLRVTCGYNNTTDRTLVYGFQGQEMCVFLAYTDAEAKIGIGSGENVAMGPNEDGVFINETECGTPVVFPDP